MTASDLRTLAACLASAEVARQRVRTAIGLADWRRAVAELESADAHLGELVAHLRPLVPN